ncbi:uncharacterized protein PRCAT00005728001 [Priceomyces carsonii]|uniref:uncharacterized protein n=1 Tax=Priceomyces carsonii TaxID=28549 RepID=UPI002ED82895|nr:unnamed protein product [Priceomyces carsonii]
MLRLFANYDKLLVRHPFLTNALTTGFLFGSGDYLAQVFFSQEGKRYDYARTSRAAVFGTFIFSPIGDKWYKLLSRVKNPFIKENTSIHPKLISILNAMIPVAMDQLIFAPFIGIPLYYTSMSVLEFNGSPLETAKIKLTRSWWDTLKTNWVIWPGFQLVNFIVVPVNFRLLVVNLFSISWNCYLSYVFNHREEGHILNQVAEVKSEDQITI